MIPQGRFIGSRYSDNYSIAWEENGQIVRQGLLDRIIFGGPVKDLVGGGGVHVAGNAQNFSVTST
jgi:hypothetical protein